MYIIKVNDDNTLCALKRERIVYRSKLVDSICFVVPPYYKDKDMSDFTVMLEYVLPISKKYGTKILTLSEEPYGDYLQYILPLDTDMTCEAGEIEMQLTFSKVELQEDETNIQYVRKTTSYKLNIVSTEKWSEIIPDDALSALDQRLIQTDAQIRALSELADTLDNDKADNIKLTDNSLQLTSNGKDIGDAVNLGDLNDEIINSNPDGIVNVVEF